VLQYNGNSEEPQEHGIDYGGGMSQEIGISEAVHSMNVAAGFVAPD
jgi:hypothetical protein